ncbi:hypothetical protein SEUCBS140593_003106 [Sporothrix eucalyptigena]|uniref:Amine oxidase n=1 Tax=Sporothrix eucalyptigena TaxID=1812306 RepID=A0ABP0BC18_9PEZI
MSAATIPHPLSALSAAETNRARDVVVSLHQGCVLDFRTIYLHEPSKADVLHFLELEHAGKVTADTPRPARLAQANFEFNRLVECVNSSPLFKKKLESIQLPPGFEVVIEPWPYGGPDSEDGQTRFFQAICFGRDTRSGNPDSNFYAYPIPLIPIMDAHKNEIIRIDEPATGGYGDPLTGRSHKATVLDHCQDAEYVPELLPQGTRKDLKPLTVVQPEGPSFAISDDNLVKWQKWSMRVTFNPREGAVLHDIRYDGRQVLYRLSMSDMV